MKKINLIRLCIAFILLPTDISAQEQTPFKPSGKAIVRSFIDYSTGFGDKNKESGFDITRAFLGYNYRITPTLQAQVVIDGASGRSPSGALEVYVRNAFINWQDYGFDISAGEIGLLQFRMQEKYWHHRYVLKSFQDLNKMSHSVDLGVTAEYSFLPILSADISITNGEGYKKVKKDNSTRYAGGLTMHPFRNAVFRAYADVYKDGGDLRESLPEGITDAMYRNQYGLSLFAGYRNDKISGGVEYSRIYNKGFIKKKDYYGYSAYSSFEVAPKWRVYARYDNMSSSAPDSFPDPWNGLDGQLTIAGIEFQPINQLKISPNFRNQNPSRTQSEQYLFVNLEFSL